MEQEFLDLIKEALEIEDRALQLSDTFREYDEWDSLGQLTLIAQLDDAYGVTIDSNTFKTLLTLQDVLNEVQKRKAE